MDLELATTEDIVEELRSRRRLFLFVGIGASNRKVKQITYAYQGGTHGELMLLMEGLGQVLANSRSNDDVDAEDKD